MLLIHLILLYIMYDHDDEMHLSLGILPYCAMTFHKPI